nr:hypothetical protein [Chloroflexota bacterium]
PSPARRRTWIVAVLALLTLLVISIPIAFAVTQRNGTPPAATATGQGQIPTTANTPTDQPTPTPNATATARAAATATVVAQVNATSTAIAGVTATAQAQASATAGVVQTATAGKATYKDALTDETKPQTQAAGWDQNSQCVFAADGYHVKEGVNLVNLHGCRESNNTYQDMAVSVDVTLLSGHSGGLFFRLHTDTFENYTGYLFEIDTQGNYKISNFAGGSPSTLQDWMASPALKKGLNAKNTLQVIARGGTLLFYANGVYLGTQTDSSYTDGAVAFLATTTDTPADVVYSNLRVYALA